MSFVSNLLGNQEISSEFEDPGIAEKGSIALRLLAERGQLKTSEVMDGSCTRTAEDNPRPLVRKTFRLQKIIGLIIQKLVRLILGFPKPH